MTTKLKCGSGITAEIERVTETELFGAMHTTSWRYEAVWDAKTGKCLRFPDLPSENPNRSQNSSWNIRPEELVKLSQSALDLSKPVMLSDGRKVHIVSTDYNPAGVTKPQIAFQIIGSSQIYTADRDSGVWNQSSSKRLVNSQIVEFRLEPGGNIDRLKPNIRATFDTNGTLVTVEKIK